MAELHIPDAAYHLGVEGEAAAITAAAPLVVAAELRRCADEIRRDWLVFHDAQGAWRVLAARLDRRADDLDGES